MGYFTGTTYGNIIQWPEVRLAREEQYMTWFGLYMLAVVLIIPASMVIVGRMFMKNAPKKINSVFGYRTKRSMQNRDTWEFAHSYIGNLWYKAGGLLLTASFVIMFFMLSKDENVISVVGAVISILQVIVVVASIFPTEQALKENFDESGKRKQ